DPLLHPARHRLAEPVPVRSQRGPMPAVSAFWHEGKVETVFSSAQNSLLPGREQVFARTPNKTKRQNPARAHHNKDSISYIIPHKRVFGHQSHTSRSNVGQYHYSIARFPRHRQYPCHICAIL